MRLIEGMSILAGLGIGYWLVSVFMHKPGKDEDPFATPAPDPDAAAPAPWHEVLGVSEWASVEDVTAAWRTRMAQYHPDKVATLGPEIRELAERKAREINQAYEDAMRRR